jgi:hypothetical protein
MLARIHAEQIKIAAQGSEFPAEIGDRDRFTIFQWVRKFFAEKKDFHTTIPTIGLQK